MDEVKKLDVHREGAYNTVKVATSSIAVVSKS